MIIQTLRRFFTNHRPSWLERHFILLLVGAALVAGGLSLSIGLMQSVWFDEAYSILLAKQSLGELLRLTGLDTHPPLYYILLKAWAGIFGWSEIALRSLSVVCAAGAVVFAGLLARKLFGVRVALLALVFVALAPLLIRYGFEIRMYALASLVGIAATYTLVSALEAKGRRQLVLYGIYAALVAIGIYALYYMALLWMAHVVWLTWLWLRDKKPLFKAQWLLAYGGSILLFLPWLPTFLSQVGNGALAPISQAMTLENLMGIISFNFVYQPVWQLTAVVSLLILFVLVVGSYISVRAFKTVDKKRRPYLVLLALYVAVPIAVLTVVSLARPMYVERYLAHIAIGGVLFIGVAAAITMAKASRVAKTAIVLLPIIMLVGLANVAQVGNYNFQRLQKPMIGQVAAELTSCKGGAMILAADPYVATELAYYVPNCQIHFYSDTADLRGGYAPFAYSDLRVEDVAKELPSGRSIMYVYYDEPKLQMPAGMQLTSLTTYEKLNVATFSAE